MATAVKICGITNREDALHAARCGAHAIGLVFHPSSPRYVGIDDARKIVAGLPPFISVIGLFVDLFLAIVSFYGVAASHTRGALVVFT